jgi:hypothetical protein
LQKKKKRESTNGLKVKYLTLLLNNSEESRWKELDKLRNFTLKLMKKNYQNAAICLNIWQDCNKKKHEVGKRRKK